MSELSLNSIAIAFMIGAALALLAIVNIERREAKRRRTIEQQIRAQRLIEWAAAEAAGLEVIIWFDPAAPRLAEWFASHPPPTSITMSEVPGEFGEDWCAVVKRFDPWAAMAIDTMAKHCATRRNNRSEH